MSEKTAAKPATPAKKELIDTKTPTPNKNKPQQDGNKHQEQNRNRGVGGGDRGGHGGHGGPQRRGGGGGGRGRFNNNRNFSQVGDRHSNMGHKNQPPQDTDHNEDGPKEDLKFTGRCRLFVGNLTPDVTEDEFKGMFTKFGEISELFVNGAKGFGFIRMDYRNNAEAAKAALDGTQRKGRSLRVRFANHGAAVRVKNLSSFVSNELLHQSFSQFGDIERAIVCVDDRGRSSGEGIVEFARKPGASQAMKRINEGVFLMSSYPRPVFVEPLEQKDEEDGLPEKFLPRNEHCRKDREKEPRFAPPGSFEFRFAQRWKELDELEKQQHERVKQDMEDARVKLEAEMEGAMYEYQAEQIRADLLRQQEELQRIEEMRQEQMRRRQEMDMRRQDDSRMVREEEERRREMIMRGEGSGMRGGRGPMDSHRSSQMDQQGGLRGEGMRGDGMRGDGMRGEGMRGEGMRGEGQRGRSGVPPPVPPPPAPPAAMGIENRQQGEGAIGSGFGGSGGNIGGGGGMGGSQGSMQGQGQGQGMGGQGQGIQRQSRFDQQGGNYGNGNFGGRGGMGGQGGGMSGGSGGGGMQGGNNMYGGGGMSGNMGGGRGGMNERRRQEAGGPRDDYGDMKRMRRY